jgi:hypothetical protein
MFLPFLFDKLHYHNQPNGMTLRAMLSSGKIVAGDLMTLNDLIEQEAQARTNLHNGQNSQRKLADHYDHVGLSGEFEFGKFCGLMPDLSSKPKGDKGIDFVVPLQFAVDVKTSRRGDMLLHEAGKETNADIFVLAHYDEVSKRCRLVGWEWAKALLAVEPKDTGRGVVNHYIPAARLRSMDELGRKMKR